MKKQTTTTLIIVLLLQTSFMSRIVAQESTEKGKILKNFSLTAQGGLLHSWGDFREDGIMPNFLKLDENKLGLGVLLNYRISKVISISGGLLSGELEGRQEEINTTGASNEPRDLGVGIYFNTDLMEVTLPRIDVNLTRIIFKDNSNLFNKLSLNAFVSHGLVYFDSKIFSIQEDIGILYGKRRGRTGKTTEAVSTLGMGLSYRLNDRFDLGLESSIRNVWSDKLDAWVTPGSADDKYSFTAVGITYHLKKRKSETDQFFEENPSVLAEEGTGIINDEGPQTIIENGSNATDTLNLIDLPNADKETVFGIYTYKKLPFNNKGLIVLDENGIAIDTIYTDEEGKFKYAKLSADSKVSFVPLDTTDIDMAELALELEGNKYEVSKQMIFDVEKGYFVDYKKLAMQLDSSVADPNLDFNDLPLDDKTLYGHYDYEKLPMADKALVVMDQDGTPLDTIFTDEFGNFLYTKMDLDNVSIIPLNLSDTDLEKVDLVLTDKDGRNAKPMKLDRGSFAFVTDKTIASTPKATPKRTGIILEKEGLSIYEGGGNFVVVAAFRGLQGSKRKVDELIKLGKKPIVTRNKRDSWYLIALDRFDDKEKALQKMREVRTNDFDDAWVAIK